MKRKHHSPNKPPPKRSTLGKPGATSVSDNARAPSAFDFDDTGGIEAGRCNNFDLTLTYEDALEESNANGYFLLDEECDPEIFDQRHYSNTLQLFQEEEAKELAMQNLQELSENQRDPSEASQKKKPRNKRSRKDLERHENRKKNPVRGGYGREGGRVEEGTAQRRRQLARNLLRSDVCKPSSFAIMTDASVASTAWQGKQMPQKKLRKWINSYKNGKITDIVATFTPIYFTG